MTHPQTSTKLRAGVAFILLAASPLGCTRVQPPTVEECAALLESTDATKSEIEAFIATAKAYLDTVPPEEEWFPANEGLGLCIGALVRKVDG